MSIYLFRVPYLFDNFTTFAPMKSHLNLYQKRAEKFAETAEILQAKFQKFSLVRLFAFIIGAAITVYLGVNFGIIVGFVVGILALTGFSQFVFWHLKIQQNQRHQAALAQINENELAYANKKYTQFANGDAYVDAAHPYTVDLDIFGDYSFFQYTNRASTIIGQQRYADYLQKNTTPTEILNRQEATTELRKKLDWRQNLQAHGLATEDDLEHLKLLETWLKEPAFVLPNKGYQLAIWLVPIWFILSILIAIFYLPNLAAVLLFLPQAWLIKKTFQQVTHVHLQTTYAEKTLAHYARLIEHIEKEKFQSNKLAQLQEAFFGKNIAANSSAKKNASAYIDDLSKIIRQLNVRYNPFAIVLNLSMMWDLKYILKLEKWKRDLKENLPQWFESLAEFEAILSLATLHYNHDDWTFPTVHENPVFTGIALGHPLIEREKRICNDIEIPTKGHIKLITGSNMAGKSTFLRTVGLNIVLAMSGAPVCAKKLELPMLQVYTSMRTQDALHESTSSFYAELKRLKFIIEAVENGDNILFLLDEILKGTNSKDRHTGSKALIQQLIDSKGSGIIATHDLELGALEATSGGSVENLRIEVEIKDGKLFFDYKLKKGVSESFNATVLMKQMGIRIKSV